MKKSNKKRNRSGGSYSKREFSVESKGLNIRYSSEKRIEDKGVKKKVSGGFYMDKIRFMILLLGFFGVSNWEDLMVVLRRILEG